MRRSVAGKKVSRPKRSAPRRPGTKGKGVRSRGLPAAKDETLRFLQAENDRLFTLLELSSLLSSTRDVDGLFEMLAVQTSVLLGAARTSIFIYDEANNQVWSKVAEGEGKKILRISADTGIVGVAIRASRIVNVPNAYRHPAFNADVDRQTGFQTRNILATPIRSHTGEITGVLEVLNKRGGPFNEQDEKMMTSIAALAGVALQNSFLIEDQLDLFESFIESSIHALGERDKITYGHTIRVAKYADMIARAMTESVREPFKSVRYSEEDLQKLRFAALLHDIGKITVPETILNKREKLEKHEVESIRARFECFKLTEKIRKMENGGLDVAGYARFCGSLDRDLDIIRRNLTPGPVTPEDCAELERMRKAVMFVDGVPQPQMTENEFGHLTLHHGNLTDEEFTVMKDHVRKTWDILGKIDWPKYLREVPYWASTHHERPNGTGYPMGLKEGDIPLEGQILAVADIYDALTAADRPYKMRIPVSEARAILRHAGEIGQVNLAIVELFLKHCVDSSADEIAAPEGDR